MPHARPVLQSLPLVCRDGHAVIVNTDSLSVVDRDTPSRDLVFTITSSLQFGKLVKFTEKLPHDMAGGWRIGDMAGRLKDHSHSVKSEVEFSCFYCHKTILYSFSYHNKD